MNQGSTIFAQRIDIVLNWNIFINRNTMRQVTLHIPDKKYSLFIELAKSLDFVKKIQEDSPNKEAILAGIKESVNEVNLIKAGKIKGIDAKDLLNEL